MKEPQILNDDLISIETQITNKPEILKEPQIMNEPKNLKDDQVSIETQITNKPEILKEPQILK
jgi:hypothetical protein